MTFPGVAKLLPHEAPMVLLDEVCFFEGDTARCLVVIGPDSMFVEDGRAPAAVVLEYMAQCVGVCTSLRAIEREEPLGSGYLVGVRELSLLIEDLEVGDELFVEATLAYDGRELGSFTCVVTRGGSQVAKGTLSVYRRRPEEDGEHG